MIRMGILTIALALAAGPQTGEAPKSGYPASHQRLGLSWDRHGTMELIFFATLEGLYADGVGDDVVDAVIPPAADAPGGRAFRESFVYSCPLCHPAFEAFRLYANREPFYGIKPGGQDTFSGSLPESIERRLLSDDSAERRAALQELIQRWVSRRLDLMRLTVEERADWEKRILAAREDGARAMEKARSESTTDEALAGWKSCAICDGSANACSLVTK